MKDFLKTLKESGAITEFAEYAINEKVEQLISERDKEWQNKYTEVKIRVKESNYEGWKFFPVFVKSEDKEFFERKFERAMKAEVDCEVAKKLQELNK